MDFRNTNVFNFEGALRGMRNPLNSWDKADSYYGSMNFMVPPNHDFEVAYSWVENENKIRKKEGKEAIEPETEEWDKLWEKYDNWLLNVGILNSNDKMADVAFLGPNDLGLAQRLIRGGPEHSKFMRQIFTSVDITAPLYWWKEADTYKVGTTANSTSTMHKLTSKPFEKSDFEFDLGTDLKVNSIVPRMGGKYGQLFYSDFQEDLIDMCEFFRESFVETKDKRYWRALVQILPNAYLQTRTWTANYAILRNIYFQRKDHKLQEWHQFCDWIRKLPYGKELITLGE